MSGTELTFKILSQSTNTAAVDLLAHAITDTDSHVRQRALSALIRRSEPRCSKAVLVQWDQLRPDCFGILRAHKSWIVNAVNESLTTRDDQLTQALAAAETLGLHASLCEIIDLAENHESEKVRVAATRTILELGHQLGRDARVGRGQSTLRAPVLSRLCQSVKDFDQHRNKHLVDAFLLVATLADAELRELMKDDTGSSQVIAQRFAETERVGVLELLTGFMTRRKIPRFILKIIEGRTDDVFRDSLLRTIGNAPSSQVNRNLADLGIPRSCLGDDALIHQISPDNRAAAVHLYSQSHQDVMVVLRVTVAAVIRDGEGCVDAAINALSHCNPPGIETWLRAAIVLADGDRDLIDSNPQACLLEQLIELLNHEDSRLVHGVRHVLRSLHAESMLDHLASLPESHQRNVGRIVMTIDADAIDRIRDGLRHPVLKNRLAAITAADALSAIDLLGESFERITREDHLQARVLACKVMAHASSEQTMGLLQEMANLPPCPVRDAAIHAIEERSVVS